MSLSTNPTPPGSTADAGGPVELILPRHHRHAATARVVTASIAASAGFDVDEIDDLRLAVDEAVSIVIALQGTAGDADEPTRLRLRFEAADGAVTVQVGTADGRRDILATDVDALARRIIEAVADEFRLEPDALVLTKRAAPRNDG